MAKIVNICVLGDSFTGKSAMINTFVNSFFDSEYSPTIENKSSKIYMCNKVLYNLNIYDTAGSKELNNLQLISDSVKKADAFIIVFSLNNRESIDRIDYCRDLIKSYKLKNMPSILVANKNDLENEIVISKTEQSDLSLYYKMPIIESSSKNLNSIYSVFNLIIQDIDKTNLENEKMEVQNRKQYLKRTKTENFSNKKLNKTKSTFSLQKKKDIINYFKTTIKDIF